MCGFWPDSICSISAFTRHVDYFRVRRVVDKVTRNPHIRLTDLSSAGIAASPQGS